MEITQNRNRIYRTIFGSGLYVCLLLLCVLPKPISAEESYNIIFSIKIKSSDKTLTKECLLIITNKKNQNIIARKSLKSGKSLDVKVPRGTYSAKALIPETELIAEKDFRVPNQRRVILVLKKTKYHILKLEFVGENSKPISNIPIIAVIGDNRKSYFNDLGSSMSTKVTDRHGKVSFAVKGEVPINTKIYIDDRRHIMNTLIMKRGKWNQNNPFLCKVKLLLKNGSILCKVKSGNNETLELGVWRKKKGYDKSCVLRFKRSPFIPRKRNYFNIPIAKSHLLLYGLTDSEYIILRLDVMGKSGINSLWAQNTMSIKIKNGEIITSNILIFSAKQKKKKIEIIFKYRTNAVTGTEVLLRRNNHKAREISDGNGVVSLDLFPGIYEIVIKHPRYYSAMQKITIKEETQSLTIKLLEKAGIEGKVTFDNEPAGPVDVRFYTRINKYQNTFSTNKGKYFLTLSKNIRGVIAFYYQKNVYIKGSVKLGPRGFVKHNFEMASGLKCTINAPVDITEYDMVVIVSKNYGIPVKFIKNVITKPVKSVLLTGIYEVFIVKDKDVYPLEDIMVKKNTFPQNFLLKRKGEKINIMKYYEIMSKKFAKANKR